MKSKARPESVDKYIEGHPPATQEILLRIRRMIRELVPEATERISYGIPVFELGGRYLLYFAGWKKHVSVYPVTPGIASALGSELDQYQDGKGTLKFPLDREIPDDLVRRVIIARVGEARGDAESAWKT